jgi:DegV family protein with EDD domain
MSVAVVTDSTAMLPPDVVAARRITVVPLQVIVGATAYDEGVDPEATPQMVAAALKEWKPVSTSRPSPAAFEAVYSRLAAAGYESVVAIHLSAQVSGTLESASLAAASSPIPVVTVDSGQLGMGTGFAVLAASDVLAAGGSASEAAVAARTRAAGTTSLFYVDTLEYLRRGGRIGAAAALVGSALSVKPLLTVRDGRITPLEKVRTSSKALARLEELAVAAAGTDPVEVAVAHLASPQRAAALAGKLSARLAENLRGRAVAVGEVGAVIGAHVGPGMVATVVAPAS